MGETPSANKQDTGGVIKRPRPSDTTLRKTFAAERRVVTGGLGGRYGQAQGDQLMQRRCACGTHTISGAPCHSCSQALSSSLLSRAPDATLKPDQASGPAARPDLNTHPGQAHDYSRIPVYADRPFPGLQPAMSGGRRNDAFLQTLIRQRQETGQTGQTTPPVGESPQGGRDIQGGISPITPDYSQTLRRNGLVTGLTEAVAAGRAANAPRLTKKTLSGPTPSNNGGYSWVIQWELSKASTSGGWIVQRVNFTGSISKADNSTVPTGWETFVPYWEAWQVRAGQKVTVYADGTLATDCQDDTYANPGYAAGTRGETEIAGSAQFYEGLTLPAAFTIIPGHPAGELRTTRSDPGLTGGSGSIDHDLSAEWDSVAGTGTTKLTTA